MTPAPFAATALALAVLVLAGCKIVPNAAPGSQPDGSVAATPTDDAARMGTLAAEMFGARLVPYVGGKAVEIATLREALATGLDKAGARYGLRSDSEGSPWNFLAKGQGRVVAADTAARAARLDLDTDGDGAADLTVQLGPVIKGTSLRDAADFLVFTDFRDQIEFAKLARALNDEASAAVALPAGDLVGQSLAFEGAFTLRAATDPILLVPTRLVGAP